MSRRHRPHTPYGIPFQYWGRTLSTVTAPQPRLGLSGPVLEVQSLDFSMLAASCCSGIDLFDGGRTELTQALIIRYGMVRMTRTHSSNRVLVEDVPGTKPNETERNVRRLFSFGSTENRALGDHIRLGLC